MKAKLSSLEQLQPLEVSTVEPPPLEREAPHRRLARLNQEHAATTEALRELKRTWAEKNIRAQATHTPIATPEITHVENRRRELADRLLGIQTEIAATNKELRARKAAVDNGEGNATQTPDRHRAKSKKCPLRDHPAFDQYFRLAAENELEAGLYGRIEAAAKSMLGHALSTGVEDV